jgi:superfamily II DNA helicase RecQ
MLEPTAEHLKVLTDVFGLASFRSRQYDAIHATLAGRDSLVVLPTGATPALAVVAWFCAG